MRSPLQTIIHETGLHGGWDIAWKKGMTGWDLGRPTKVLLEELTQERKLLFESSTKMKSNGLKALIPGCGGGYDLITVAHHFDAIQKHASSDTAQTTMDAGTVIGLDISPTSVKQTHTMLESFQNSTPDLQSSLQVICDDFFTAEIEKFDFIFDYTFFCAIPPSFREKWGQRMGELVVPGGKLLTLAFPVVLSDTEMQQRKQDETLVGPPYPVTMEEYTRMLEPHGFTLVKGPMESEFTEDSRKGKEKVIWWKKVEE